MGRLRRADRRWFAAVAAVAALALAGCSMPAGVDGNLVDDWSSMPRATQDIPAVGDCYISSFSDLLDNAPLPCTESHMVEVAYVGTFTGTTAARLTPPPPGSATLQSTYTACQKPIKTYLGADWHAGLVEADLMVPDTNGWSGGARWYACTVNAVYSLDDELTPTTSIASLKGALAPGSPHRITCVRWTDHRSAKPEYVDNITLTTCSHWFNGEYAGSFTTPIETWPSSESKRESIAQDGCEGVVAKYLGFSDNTDESYYVGWLSFNFDKDRWDLGDRTVRCFTYTSRGDGRFTASVKGIKAAKPKD